MNEEVKKKTKAKSEEEMRIIIYERYKKIFLKESAEIDIDSAVRFISQVQK